MAGGKVLRRSISLVPANICCTVRVKVFLISVAKLIFTMPRSMVERYCAAVRPEPHMSPGDQTVLRREEYSK